jgi:transcriptional regulator with XRE-family HTH domain
MGGIEKRFGERVRELRKACGLSQEELAHRAGVHRTYLGGIERGERNPSLRNISAIAEALQVTLSDLFSFSGPPDGARSNGLGATSQ